MHHIVFSYHEFRELCVFREETGDWCEMTISAIENVAADFMIPGHRVIWDQGSRGPAPPGHHYQLSTIQCQTQLKLFSHFNWWRRFFWIINKTNFYSSCFFCLCSGDKSISCWSQAFSVQFTIDSALFKNLNHFSLNNTDCEFISPHGPD